MNKHKSCIEFLKSQIDKSFIEIKLIDIRLINNYKLIIEYTHNNSNQIIGEVFEIYYCPICGEKLRID